MDGGRITARVRQLRGRFCAGAPYLINPTEGVEGIPGTALVAQGMDFRWESFPENLDALAATPRTAAPRHSMPRTVILLREVADWLTGALAPGH